VPCDELTFMLQNIYTTFTSSSSANFLCCAGYIGEFEFVDDHRGGKLVVELNGR